MISVPKSVAVHFLLQVTEMPHESHKGHPATINSSSLDSLRMSAPTPKMFQVFPSFFTLWTEKQGLELQHTCMWSKKIVSSLPGKSSALYSLVTHQNAFIVKSTQAAARLCN